MHSNRDPDSRRFDKSDEQPDDRIVYETPRGRARRKAAPKSPRSEARKRKRA